MTDVHTEQVLRPMPGQWLDASVPAELAMTFSDYDEVDRERLAAAAAEAAFVETGEAYQNPFVRNAARSAARMALGLKPLPEEGEI